MKSSEKQLEAIKAQHEFDYKENQLIAQQKHRAGRGEQGEGPAPQLVLAGWRPAIGWVREWVGAIAVFYRYVPYPMLEWISMSRKAPSPLPNEMLITLITGILGIAGLRTFDKLNRVDTKSVG